MALNKKLVVVGFLFSTLCLNPLFSQTETELITNPEDTLSIFPDSLSFTFSMYEDDPILKQLDSLSKMPWFMQTEGLTWADPQNGLSGREKVVTPDSIIIQRLEALNNITPVNLVFNDQVKAYIDVYANRRAGVTARVLGLSHLYFPMIEETFDRLDAPLELKYLAIVESALNPAARSPAGAMGLWQFMYGTGKMFGLQVNSLLDERKDPIKSTEAAAKYLLYLHNIYNDWDLALAAYNCGPGNVNKAIRRAGGGKKTYWDIWPFLPRETRGYVPAFIAVNYVMNYAQEYGIPALEPKFLHFQVDTILVKENLNFDPLVKVLDVPMSDLQYLNPLYRAGVIPKTDPPQILYLPTEAVGKFISFQDSLYTLSKGIKQDFSKLAVKEDRVVYKVKSGDNLGKIAQNHKVTVNQLKEWNGLKTTNIRVGQSLVIYSPTAQAAQAKKQVTTASSKNTSSNNIQKKEGNVIVHVVQQGDTLWDIAKRYEGVSIEDIKSRNKQLNASSLKPGQKIIIGPAT
ncbi:MAG: LysM peptidoglycan-binding domain-containing protein [Luteibaculaceae bacterium]